MEINLFGNNDIRQIWIGNEAESMIDRFKQAINDPILFFRICEKKDRIVLNNVFGMPDLDIYISFFKWIKYDLDESDIELLLKDSGITKKWKELNGMDFYYFLPKNIQLKMINNYNLMMA